MTGAQIRRRRLLAAALASPVALAGSRFAGASDDPLTPLEPRITPPDFSLPDLDGDTVSYSDLLGQVSLINFWATWCPPCRAEMPALERLWSSLRDDEFGLYGVNVDESPQDIEAFEATLDTRLSFPLLLDRGAELVQSWEVFGLPMTFILDRQGRVAYRIAGEREWDGDNVVMSIRALLLEPVPTS